MDNQHKKISGYRDLSQAEIDLMNAVKAKAEEVRELLDSVRGLNIDARWWAIAQTDLQKGFMALTRSIAQPTTF
jgi:flagellar biosynthesis regulator FlaF